MLIEKRSILTRFWVVGSVFLAIYFLFNLVLIPSRVHAQAGPINLAPDIGWRATESNGNAGSEVFTSGNMPSSNRFVWLTPQMVKDTKTGTIYKNKSSEDTFFKHGSRPRADGWFYFYPFTNNKDGDLSSGTEATGDCPDILGSDKAGSIYMIPNTKLASGSCYSFSDGEDSPASGVLNISSTITGNNVLMSYAVAKWVDKETIKVYGKDITWNKLSDSYKSANGIGGDGFSNLNPGSGGCVITNSDKLNGWLLIESGSNNTKGTIQGDDKCMANQQQVKSYPEVGNPKNIVIAETTNMQFNLGENPNDPAGGSAADKSKIECAFSWNPLTWFMCPLVLLADQAVTQLDNAITNALTIDVDSYFEDGKQFHNAWGSIRNISLGLLVIIGLIMVISQALSFGPFDAYTIRKVMPRLVIAVIFISISWPLLKFMILFSNVLGQAVRGLVETALDSGTVEGNTVKIAGGALTLGSIGAAGLGLSLGFLGILSLLGTALLAVMLAFGVLVVRQLLIIVLVITAPFAIACYILPNTEKVWKIWWDFFIRAIFAFPIIMLFIATGRAFASISTSSDNDTLHQIIAFVAYFGPYFALPFAFRLAGGAIAQIGGLVNDRSRGAFDRLKKFRQGQSAQNMQKMSYGDRFQRENALTKGFNRTTVGLATGTKGRFGIGKQGRGAIDVRKRLGQQQAIQNNPLLQQLAYDDNAIAVMALSGGTRAGAERAATKLAEANGWDAEKRDRAVSTAASIGFNSSNAMAGMQLLAQNKSRALKGALSGDAGMELVRESAEAISGGNSQLTENMMGGFAFHSRNAVRLDLGGESKGGVTASGWNRSTVGQHMQAFGESTQHFVDEFNEDIRNSNDLNSREAAAIAFSEMYHGLPGASDENRNNILKGLSDIGVRFDATRTITQVDNNGQQQTVNVPISIEEQLANIANGVHAQAAPGTAGLGATSASNIQAKARQYGAATPYATREGEPPAAPTPPAPSP